jgi:hypothetical protein
MGIPHEAAQGADFTHRCHINDFDDSWIEGSDYRIPDDTDFWIAGRRISREQLCYQN